jgi:hypothetical protein
MSNIIRSPQQVAVLEQARETLRMQNASRMETSINASTNVRIPPNSAVLAGERYGRFVILGHEFYMRRTNGNYQRWVVAQCDCGAIGVKCPTKLKMGHVRSCGCLMVETSATINFKDGASRHLLYRCWCAMITRCYSTKSEAYSYYGGRGITVCERWQASFWDFVEDMGPRPTPSHEIDRYPNNNGNYEPGNCRWATRVQQMRNTRSTLRLTLNGETLSLAEWCERLGLNSVRVASRLRLGWSVERAFTTPVQRQGSRNLALGVTLNEKGK